MFRLYKFLCLIALFTAGPTFTSALTSIAVSKAASVVVASSAAVLAEATEPIWKSACRDGKYQPGDLLAFLRFQGLKPFFHYALVINDQKVSHFNSIGSTVILDDGSEWEVGEHQIDYIWVVANNSRTFVVRPFVKPKTGRSLKEMRNIALELDGKRELYNVWLNNCEHKANQLKYNLLKSWQVDSLTTLPKLYWLLKSGRDWLNYVNLDLDSVDKINMIDHKVRQLQPGSGQDDSFKANSYDQFQSSKDEENIIKTLLQSYNIAKEFVNVDGFKYQMIFDNSKIQIQS